METCKGSSPFQKAQHLVSIPMVLPIPVHTNSQQHPQPDGRDGRLRSPDFAEEELHRLLPFWRQIAHLTALAVYVNQVGYLKVPYLHTTSVYTYIYILKDYIYLYIHVKTYTLYTLHVDIIIHIYIYMLPFFVFHSLELTWKWNIGIWTLGRLFSATNYQHGGFHFHVSFNLCIVKSSSCACEVKL